MFDTFHQFIFLGVTDPAWILIRDSRHIRILSFTRAVGPAGCEKRRSVMKGISSFAKIIWVLVAIPAYADAGFERDVIPTSKGPLEITCIGHGTLMLAWDGRMVHVDPVGQYADYSKLPKADLILVTHEHGDHLDAKAIGLVSKADTKIVLNPSSASKLGRGDAMRNGENRDVLGILITAVPAYNTTPGRDKFHPKGRDNGYVLAFADKKVYVAGDTEDIPEMKDCAGADAVFLPVNQPYTMTPVQAAAAARTIKPKILYPYHFGDTRIEELKGLLKDEPGIEVRIRKMK